ncbi:MAG: nucleotidyltransferase domain-containing protein [Caldilineaceae bacterium]|nr:nucleotidyltransferase domain-containing protein [Caldilineaceae bacterium]
MTQEMLTQCRWPPLREPYESALREAVAFILARFEVHGIVVSGSIIHGNPHPGSDFDIMVLHAKPQRQRLQRFFHGVPTEIFVNPLQSIRGYFAEERKEGKPSTAHMWSTGFVLLDRDPLVNVLRQEAAEWLQKAPDQTPLALTIKRYFSADEFENALDVADSDPAMASLLMHHAIFRMIEYRFLVANLAVPRHKEMLTKLKEIDPPTGELVEHFLTEPDLQHQFVLGKQVAQALNGEIGFFEWETELETIVSV